MPTLQAVNNYETEAGTYTVTLRAAFIEVGYNFLSHLRKNNGQLSAALKAERAEFAEVLRNDIITQGLPMPDEAGFAKLVTDTLAEIARQWNLPGEVAADAPTS